MYKVLWTYLLVLSVCIPVRSQSGEKDLETPLKLAFDIGLVTSGSALQPGVPWYPDVVPLAGINLFHNKSKIGLRYRMEFWYRLNQYRLEYATVFQGSTARPINLWERTNLEVYRTFTLPNKDFSFNAGFGRSRIFPSWFGDVSIEYPFFVSHQIDWFTLEFRVSYRPQKARGRNTDLGFINLSAYYTFPNKQL